MAVEKIDDLSYLSESIEPLDVKLKIIMTTTHVDATYMSKKKNTFILFINNRLVSSDSLKRAISQTYSLYIPKGNHYFIYLSIEIRADKVDVNVHPNKKEVSMMH